MNYDVIVIGGGHNGLTTAAMLGKKGKKVLLVEKNDFLGGLAASKEFHAGYKNAGLLQDTSSIRPAVVEGLKLKKYGLAYYADEPGVYVPQEDGKGVTIYNDIAKMEKELQAFSPKDAAGYKKYRSFMDKLDSKLVGSVINNVFPNLTKLTVKTALGLIGPAIKLRMLGKKDMMEVLRLLPMCAADYVAEFFESEVIRAAIAAPAVYGNNLGPWSPGTNMNLLLWECGKNRRIKGGASSLINALEKAARDNKVEIRTGAEVESIIVEDNKACGIALKGGETIKASKIASSCDPQTTLLKLVPAGTLEYQAEHRMEKYRSRGTTTVIHFALNKPLEYKGKAGQKIEFARFVSSIDHMEQAFDHVKYGEYAQNPVLEITVPSFSDPSLCPDGHCVVTVQYHFCARDLRVGWSEEVKNELCKIAVAKIASHTEGFETSIVGREVLSPEDIEQHFGVTGGHLRHGDETIDQIVSRPIPDCFSYNSPIDSLYTCGSGNFPGGGLSCAPGSLAVQAILS